MKKLTGANLKASDLRAGASLVVAALMAEGYSEIENLSHIDRGYENLEYKLRKLGANIERLNVSDDLYNANTKGSLNESAI